MLVKANSRPHDIVIYTDGSVKMDRSGWRFTIKQGGRTVHEDSGAHRVTTSSLTMEIEACNTVASLSAWHTDYTCQTQWTSCKRKSLEWASPTGTQPSSLPLQRLLWIYRPGHAGVSGTERADRLASTADITSGLQLGRAEVFRCLRIFLNMDRPKHHSIDRLKERGMEKKEAVDIPPY